MTKDPICEMTVDEATSLHAERDGQTSYFCSEHCRKKFLAGADTGKPEAEANAMSIYTCPMHPEVRQDHPGSCPKCGMALESMDASAGNDEGDNAELKDKTRRFWIGAALALPVCRRESAVRATGASTVRTARPRCHIAVGSVV